MLERDYQSELKKRLRKRFPGCIVLKNDPNIVQGIPDLLVLHKNKWGALECKANEKAKKRPNQDHYIDVMNEMSFASYIYPENEEEVLNAMERTFET